MNESLQQIGYALGTAILNSFWQMGLLWLLVQFTAKLHRRMSATALSNLSFAALLTGFLAFAGSFFIALINHRPPLGIPDTIWQLGPLDQILNYTALLYLVLLILPIAKLLKGGRQLYQLKYTGRSRVPGNLKIFLLNAANYLGIKRSVQIYLSTQVSSPLTLGFLRPVILLPVSLISRLSPLQLEALILHELAHIRRNDYLINFLTQLMLTLMYFNPFARALAGIQHLEREKAADNWVLQFEYNNHMYASTLLQLVREKISGKSLLAVAATGNTSPLYHRIEWIMGNRIRKGPTGGKIWGAVLSSVILCCLCLHLNQPVPDHTIAKHPTVQPIKVLQVVASSPEILMETKPVQRPPQTAKVHAIQKEADAPSINEQKPPVAPADKKDPPHTESNSPAAAAKWPDALIEEPDVAVISFISHHSVTGPVLTAAQEQQLQQSLQAVRRVIAEAHWKQLETALAESMTGQQKAALKAAFIAAFNRSEISKNAESLLREHFGEIDWQSINSNLKSALQDIRLDSLQNKYQSDLETLLSVRKKTGLKTGSEKDSTIHPSGELEMINQQIDGLHQQLQVLDSLRHQRIVEL